MSRRAAYRVAIRSLPVLLVAGGGCQKPDLRVSDLTASASSANVIEFEYEIENRAWGEENIFAGGAPVLGPVNVQAYTSSDGETLGTPASVFYTPVLPTETLGSGEVVRGTGVASADIDLSQRPYLILVVDPRTQRDDQDPLNNRYAVRIGDAASAPTGVTPAQPPAVVAPVLPITKPPTNVQMYPFTSRDAIAPEAAIDKKDWNETDEEAVADEAKGIEPNVTDDGETGTGGVGDTEADTLTEPDTDPDANTDPAPDPDTTP